MNDDPAFRDWIERAKRMSVRGELVRRGLWNEAKMSGDRGNPCPACRGTKDTFCVNTRRNVFICHRSGAAGGAGALAMHIDGTDFITACETVTGEPRPKGGRQESAEERRAREERYAREQRQAEEKALSQARSERAFRDDERRRMYKLWRQAVPIAGTLAEAYLQKRGLMAPAEATLRYLPDTALWNEPPPKGEIIHKGPALACAIVGPDGRFAGLQRIWIDLNDAKGKARIPDPETGELIAAKKSRGSQKGGSILWAKAANDDGPEHFWLGEGIETVGSVHNRLVRLGHPFVPISEFRSGVSLGNLAGKAAGRVPHPTLTFRDKLGRVRRQFVRNAEPSPDDDTPFIAIPDSVSHLWIIGDGDSDPFATRLALERAGTRYARAYPWLTVRFLMAPLGKDFNDVWLEELEKEAA